MLHLHQLNLCGSCPLISSFEAFMFSYSITQFFYCHILINKFSAQHANTSWLHLSGYHVAHYNYGLPRIKVIQNFPMSIVKRLVLGFLHMFYVSASIVLESMSLVFAFLELGMVLTINKFLAFILLALEHFQVSSLLSVQAHMHIMLFVLFFLFELLHFVGLDGGIAIKFVLLEQ